jgi:hypothetical protein
MRKGLALKLVLTCAAVGAMTLLQGCEGEDVGSGVGGPWTVVGFPWTLVNYATGGGAGTTPGAQPGAGAPASGGQTVASAVASARGTGGGQVSGAGYAP